MTTTHAAYVPTESYGIHLLKVGVILLQVIAHSYLWSVQKGLIVTTDIGNLWNNATYTLLSTALILPMTAGAVLRMVTPVDTDQDRIVGGSMRAVLIGSLLLALIESVKQALVYSSGVFFSWNVLHVIAVACPLIVLIGRYSILLLWSVALTIIFATPLMIELLAGSETHQWLKPSGGLPLASCIFVGLWSLFVLGLVRRIWRSVTMAPVYKGRALIILAIIWTLVAAGLAHWGRDPTAYLLINTLPMGATVGTTSGMHIWAFFPWAGTIMLGFLIFDALIRMRATTRALLLLLATGLCLLTVFYLGFANDVTSTLTAKAVFGGYHFNRLPSKILMVVGLFCLAVPLCVWLARRGAERPYVVLLSRYVLWLYVYQTTVQMLIPPFVQQHMGVWLSNWQCVALATVLSVVTTLALPWLIKRIPLSLNLKLRKAR